MLASFKIRKKLILLQGLRLFIEVLQDCFCLVYLYKSFKSLEVTRVTKMTAHLKTTQE